MPRGLLTFSLDPSLDRDSCKDDAGTGPLASSELVLVYDDGKEHREEFSRQRYRTENEPKGKCERGGAGGFRGVHQS